MLTRTAVITCLVAVLSIVKTGQEKPLPESVTKFSQAFKNEVPRLKEAFAALEAATPAPPSDAGPLPRPSLTEPFEIGEALYDEGRVANAVVSLLRLMEVGVVADANASARATGITLSESEVRALIDLALEDLVASENDMERLPYKFTDLHAGIAELLPGVTVEALAEAYTKAYQARPDDLIAKAMMGRPIEPDTTLTRAQLWFLLMDGFAGAAATGGRWGTADREAPDLKLPDAKWSPEEFREVLARLPLVTAGRLVTMSAPGVTSQGATAGPPVNVTARVNASPSPLVSRATGRTLIAARAAGSLSGQDVTWHVHEESMLHEIGKIETGVDDPTRVGADGIARFTFQPGADPTKGAGQWVDEWETVEARFETRGLVANAYSVPTALAGLTIGASRTHTDVHLKWRSPDVLYLSVTNLYQGVTFDIPGLGGGTRVGSDYVISVLHKRGDGSYVGRGVASVTSDQQLRGPVGLVTCKSTSAKQQVRVKAEPELIFPIGPTRDWYDFVWINAQITPAGGYWTNARPDGGYYRVMFYPKTEPDPPTDDPCMPFIPAEAERRGWGATKFIPFNDAQWTTPGQGYGIGLRAKGFTGFMDLSSVDPLGLPLPEVKAAFKLTGWSLWAVTAAYRRDEFLK